MRRLHLGAGLTLAVTETDGGRLVGAIGLSIHKKNRVAELGYWIGKPHWNKGYATQAAEALLEYAFEHLSITRHMTGNPASGRVMEKIGMQFEGVLRQSSYRWGSFRDIAMYSILREEFQDSA